jgi:hypothetical protein
MHPRALILAAALAASLPAAAVRAQVVGPDRFAVYVALSGLEATAADATRAGLLAAFPGLSDAARTQAARDYAMHAAHMEERIDALRAMAVEDNALLQFAESIDTRWRVLSTEGETLISQAEGAASHRESVQRWQEGLVGFDEVIDIALESVLTGTEIEG